MLEWYMVQSCSTFLGKEDEDFEEDVVLAAAHIEDAKLGRSAFTSKSVTCTYMDAYHYLNISRFYILHRANYGQASYFSLSKSQKMYVDFTKLFNP